MSEMLTTKETANKARLTIRAIQKVIEQGRLTAKKVGRDYIIAEEDLVRLTKPRRK
jgi:excisionase family DNA binding protein